MSTYDYGSSNKFDWGALYSALNSDLPARENSDSEDNGGTPANTTSTTYVDTTFRGTVTGIELDEVTQIHVLATVSASSAGVGGWLQLYRNTTGNTFGPEVPFRCEANITTGDERAVSFMVTDKDTSGSVTYGINWKTKGSGTIYLGEATFFFITQKRRT